jgi:hypothetical protein
MIAASNAMAVFTQLCLLTIYAEVVLGKRTTSRNQFDSGVRAAEYKNQNHHFCPAGNHHPIAHPRYSFLCPEPQAPGR